MTSKNENTQILAIEVWTTAATEDAELGPNAINLIHPVAQNLIIVLLQLLVKAPDNYLDEGRVLKQATRTCRTRSRPVWARWWRPPRTRTWSPSSSSSRVRAL